MSTTYQHVDKAANDTRNSFGFVDFHTSDVSRSDVIVGSLIELKLLSLKFHGTSCTAAIHRLADVVKRPAILGQVIRVLIDTCSPFFVVVHSCSSVRCWLW